MPAMRKNWLDIVSGEHAIAACARDYMVAVKQQQAWIRKKEPVLGMKTAMETSPFIEDVQRKERAMDLKIAEFLGIQLDKGNSASVAGQVVMHPGQTGEEALDLLDRFYKLHNDAIEKAQADLDSKKITGRAR